MGFSGIVFAWMYADFERNMMYDLGAKSLTMITGESVGGMEVHSSPSFAFLYMQM